jgi:hypothetical protein
VLFAVSEHEKYMAGKERKPKQNREQKRRKEFKEKE